MPTPNLESDRAPQESLDDLFTASVRKFPNRPALVLGKQSWTYSELDAQCNSIEGYLREAGFTGTQSHIGLIYARTKFSYASLIAIMRSGNVYVPLNGKLPTERLVKMIDDADLAAVIIDASDGLPETIAGALRQTKLLHVLVKESPSGGALDAIRESAPNAPAVEPRIQMDRTRLAYIIYTSGSTGIPKGVAIEHGTVYRSIRRMHALFGTNEYDRFTQFSPLSFDGSIFDLFVCWSCGGASCVPTPEEALVPWNFVIDNEITAWGSVPSLANFLLKLQLLKPSSFPRIRVSSFFGEALPVELALAWMAAAPSSRIFNLYGPTECSICATYFEYDRQSRESHGMVPIGVPLPGVRCAVVDDGRLVVEDDLPGELWLSGDQLAVGYWNNTEATRDAFVQAPFDDKAARWYRTGDLVSNHRGVGLTFRGRLDRQVKLRGLRIELQEIEGILRDVTGCALVAVVPVRGVGGICEKLVAYCENLSSDEVTVKERCKGRMASYMVPERIVELKELPLSDHGKIDYRSLIALTATTSEPASQCAPPSF